MLVGTQPAGLTLAEVSWPLILQAELLREWNQLDAAQELATEAISLCKQTKSLSSLLYLLIGYAVLLRICLSRRELEVAYAALQQFEHLGMRMSQPSSLFHHSYFTTIDQVRLWLACGELEHATRWAQELDVAERQVNPFVREREEVARVRVLLAKSQPDLALQHLEPVLKRATMGKRWGHVIEMQLLQALAYQMCNQQMQARTALSEAVRLAEPEGYISSFVDEGEPMVALLCRLREELRKGGPTPYLDRVLAAFPQQSNALPEPYRNA